jgi:membrane-associated phospholipid phosphatase
LGGTGTGTLSRIDQAILLRLVHMASGGLAADLVRLLLAVARHGAVWIVLAALVFILGGRRGRRLAITTGAALGMAAVLAELILMGLVERAGPSTVLGSAVHVTVPNPAPFSFPCAVAALSFAAAPLLARLGSAWAVSCWLLATGIALAAVAAGQCFPSDAIGGLLTGVLCARITVWALGEPMRRRGRMRPPARRPAGG